MKKSSNLTEKHWIMLFHLIDAQVRKVNSGLSKAKNSTALNARMKAGILQADLETLEAIRDFAILQYVDADLNQLEELPVGKAAPKT